MLAILVWSCSRDDSNEFYENQVQPRQSVDYQIDNFDPPRTYEDLRDCYNQFVKDGVETFNEKFGEDLSKRITYISDGNVSQVIPLFKGEELENLVWINEEYYFLLNISEERDSLNNPLRSYSRIFNLSRTELLTGNTSSLSQYYSIQNTKNELRLTELIKTATPDDVYGKPYSPCSHWEDEWLLVYYDFLGLIPPLGGDLPPDVIELSTMNQIINSVTGGACVCPTPCLVIQALNEHPDVMQSAKDQVSINQIVAEFGISGSYPFEFVSSEILNFISNYSCTDHSSSDCYLDDDIRSLIFNSFQTQPFDNAEFTTSLNNILNSTIEATVLDVNCEDWNPPCWQEVLGYNINSAVIFEDWCARYSGLTFEQLNGGGWIPPLQTPAFIEEDWRYIIDPTNNLYVIDITHVLFIGFWYESIIEGGGDLGGLATEIYQTISWKDILDSDYGNSGNTGPNSSAFRWQDFFSNYIGVAFFKYLNENNIDFENNTNFVDLLCGFLDSPESLFLRPFPDPNDC